MIVLRPTVGFGTYEFIAAKRGSKIGWGRGVLGRYFKWSADPNVQKWEESERPEGDKKSEAESEYKKTKYFLVPNYLVVLQNNAGKTKTEQKWELAAKTGDNKHVVNEKVEKLIAMGRIKEEVLPKVPRSKRSTTANIRGP